MKRGRSKFLYKVWENVFIRSVRLRSSFLFFPFLAYDCLSATAPIVERLFFFLHWIVFTCVQNMLHTFVWVYCLFLGSLFCSIDILYLSANTTLIWTIARWRMFSKSSKIVLPFIFSIQNNFSFFIFPLE